MFRPPDSYNHPQTTILDLPDELLLNIGAQITHLSRNCDLASLSLVSKKWRIVAQEWLLKKPRFNLTHIDKYLWEIGHHAHLLPQIRSLEIWSKSENRIPRNSAHQPEREYKPIAALSWDPAFVAKCKELINIYARDQPHARKWHIALDQDCIPALLGVLICTLPNLRELRLGDTWLMDIPLMSVMVSPDVKSHRMLPREWRHGFLAGAVKTLHTRLHVLEVPADMTCIWFLSRWPTIYNFRPFEALREVGITMRALWWCPQRSHQQPPDPRELFPRSLQVLRITEATMQTTAYLANLCAAKKGGHFPNLRRVEVYYLNRYDVVEDLARTHREPHPLWGVHSLCRDVEVELYVYFPPYELKTWEMSGVPWRLMQEKDVFAKRLETAFWKRMGPFGVKEEVYPVVEMEWDRDGDAVMIRE
jgi:hypothetical protein